jgi:glycosyltransferase involved in cell wall biosynthesis
MADGAEGIHIREIVSALRGLGHEVLVEALAGDPTQPVVTRRQSKLAGLRRSIPDAMYEVAELGYNIVGYRRLLRAARHFRPDVIYDRYNSYSTAALRAARRLGVPLLLEVNAPVAYEREMYEHLRLKFPALARRYERRIFEGADRIFVVSTPLKRHLVETIGIDESKIVVLPNGVDPDRFSPSIDGTAVRQRYRLDDRLVIGFVGILRPWHGVDLLLTAFQRLRERFPTVHLLIIGDGPIQAQLESQARDLGIADAVTFTGRVAYADVPAHIAVMDVTVSPQATFYASPMKILEYMAMRKLVVAPSMDNIRDIIEDRVSGLLFTAGDSGSLQWALTEALQDLELKCRVIESAHRRVVERFNWRHNAEVIANCASLRAH